MRKRQELPPFDKRRARLAGILYTDLPTLKEQRANLQKQVGNFTARIEAMQLEAANLEEILAKEESDLRLP